VTLSFGRATNMRQLFLVLAKLIGLIQLYWSLATLVQIGVSIEMLTAESKPEIYLLIKWGLVGFGAYFLLTLGLAWILLIKTDWLADKLGISDDIGPSIVSEAILLSAGIRLIGLYVAVTAAPALIKVFIETKGMAHGLGISSTDLKGVAQCISVSAWANIIRNALELCLGAFLAFKADTVMPYIAGKNEIEK
jgi:hypothetical protein